MACVQWSSFLLSHTEPTTDSAIDVIIGIALGSYIIDNSAWIAESLSEILSLYTIVALERALQWVKNQPAVHNPHTQPNDLSLTCLGAEIER